MNPRKRLIKRFLGTLLLVGTHFALLIAAISKHGWQDGLIFFGGLLGTAAFVILIFWLLLSDD